MDGDVGDVEAAGAVQRDVERRGVGVRDVAHPRRDAPYVDGAVAYVEGGTEAVQRPAAAQVHGGIVARPDVAHALCRDQPPEFLHHDDGAAGDIHRQLLQREKRALAAAVADRIGDFGAAVGAGGGDLVDRVVPDQVADVRDDPRRAGLDELVVVELLDVVLDDAGLRGHDGEEGLQLAAVRGVAGAVDGGQQREELVGVEAHDQSPMLPWVAGSSRSIWAPCGGTGPLAHSSGGTGPAAASPLRPSAWSWTAMTPAVR